MAKKILIVDDMSSIRMMYKSYLRGEFDIAEAENGLEALQMIEQSRPDLIILDVAMPKMDGIECCRRIKSHPETKHIPIIIVTALGDHAQKNAAVSAGCDSYIHKPVRKDRLVGKVWLLLRINAGKSS